MAPPKSASGGGEGEKQSSGEKRARGSPTSAEQCEEFDGGLRPVTELFPGLPSVPGDEQAVPCGFEWTPELLNDESVRVKAADHVGAPLSAVALMQWKAAMEKFVDLVRPALVATQNTMALLAAAGVQAANFEAVIASLDRGELRSTAAVKALVGELAGAVLEQFLSVERRASAGRTGGGNCASVSAHVAPGPAEAAEALVGSGGC